MKSTKAKLAASAALVLMTASIVSIAVSDDKANERSGSRAAQLSERFKELDVDRDSQLSKLELGSKLFEFLNTDDNEHVTLPEVLGVLRTKGFDAIQKVANEAEAEVATSATQVSSVENAAPVRQGPKRLSAGDHGVGRLLPDLPLTDIDGQAFSLSSYKGKVALVISLTNTSCPICKKYTPSLAAIESDYAKQNVAFLFVNPTSSDKLEAIRSVIADNELDGHYVRDDKLKLASALNATHTTDVFVLDAKRTVIYRGAVDDQYGFGYTIDQPRVEYLKAALDAMIAGERPEITATEAPGCPLDIKLDASLEPTLDSVTYHNQVSRIMANHCVECHRDGGVGPFSLEDFESVASQSGSIRRVVEDDIMPPWFAARSTGDEASPFINDCSLSSHDKKTLLAWLSSGKVEGNADDAPVPRAFTSGWQIGEPDLVLQMPKPIAVKASGTMPYENVIVETGFTEDRFIKAVEVKPTARQVVHHCLVFVLPPASGNGSNKAERRGDDETDGFFAAYAPGYDALVFNEGYGKVIPAGSRLKFQMHYTPNGTATSDQSMIGMIFADDVPERLVNVAAVAQHRLAIPPNTDNYKVVANITVPKESTMLAFFPHMHLRGKAFRYEAIMPDGITKTLLDIPRYDFNWQLSYRLAEPLTLPAGAILRATAWYDNSVNNPANPDPNRIVPWGPQTFDEMMIGYVEYYMEEGKIDRFASVPEIAALRTLGSGAGLETMFKQLDKDKDGKLSVEELPQGQQSKLMRLDTDGDEAISMKEAERLKQLLNRKP